MFPELPIPHPFNDGRLTTFGLMVVLGFLAGTFLLYRLAERRAHDPERQLPGYSALPTWILIGILAGARLLYVLVEVGQGSEIGRQLLAEPWRIVAIWEPGLVMYGGTIGGLLGGLLCCRKHDLPFWHALDLGLVAGFLGLGFGRIGCILVGDDYGKVVPDGSHLPFPVAVTVPDPLPSGSLFPPELAGQTLYATQLWMSANAFLLCGIGLWLLSRRRFQGQVALTLFVLYAVGRFTIESFRGDEGRGLWMGGLSTSQLISIVFGVGSLVLLLRRRGRRDPLPDNRGDGGPRAVEAGEAR